ncbi:RNA polymerase II-associated protein 1-like isoform X2 [Oscarella lobularis]|uniref:RNA polymerase II-associated protein 1-like isoform X2 n=1 Tax=Oscarella lobularis TaxID=121494 RepID=UPI0033132F05
MECSRPRRNESEEELLRLQDEFLASGTRSSARLIKAGPRKGRDVVVLDDAVVKSQLDPPKKKSRFAETRKNREDLSSPADALDRHDRHVVKVLSDVIQERDTSRCAVRSPSYSTKHGFPTVFRVEEKEDGEKSDSLFAKSVRKEKKEPQSPLASSANLDEDMDVRENDGGVSVLSAEERRQIDEDNAKRMASMTREEIIQEQEKLEKTLGSDLVAFLKKRGQKMNKEETAKVAEYRVPNDAKHIKGLADKNAWLHMDTLEPAKLEWIQTLSTSSSLPPSHQSTQVRFDFNGSIVPKDADVATREGLHHHGENPEAAGYTLSELFQMARSNVIQQRVLSLRVLARILTQRIDVEDYDEVTSFLANGALPLLTRWALDDSVEAISTAALHCLHALIVEDGVEDALDGWLAVPQLKAAQRSEEVKEKDRDDLAILKEDLILGLLRMQLLPRLRYLVEVGHLQSLAVIHVLEILIRVARHSVGAASQVVQCSRLVDTIVTLFMPKMWTNPGPSSLTDVYGLPLPRAVKLMSVLCAAGRNIASTLIAKHGVLEPVVRYLSQKPSELGLPDADVLAMQSYYFLATCLSYGHASHVLSSFYPLFLLRLQDIMPASSQPCGPHGEDHCPAVCSAFLGMLESSIHVASKQPTSDDDRCGTKFVSPSIHWEHVEGFVGTSLVVLRKCLVFLGDVNCEIALNGSVLDLVGGLLSVYSSYCHRVTDNVRLSERLVECLDEISDFSCNVLTKFFDSPFHKQLWSTLGQACEHCGTSAKRRNSLPSLPSLSSCNIVPCLSKNCRKSRVSRFLLQCSRLLLSVTKLHKKCLHKDFVEGETVLVYLESSLRHASQTKQLSRLECNLHHCLLQHFVLTCEASGLWPSASICSLYFSVGCQLLVQLQPGDEIFAYDLLNVVPFNVTLLRKVLDHGDISLKLGDLNLEESSVPLTDKEPPWKSRSLVEEAMSHIADVRQMFLASFILEKKLERQLNHSRSIHMRHPYQTERLMMPAETEVILPADWMFGPIIDIQNRLAESGFQSDRLLPNDLRTIQHTLRLVLLLELSDSLAMNLISLTTRLSRTMCVFLTGSDVFLDSVVRSYLSQLFCIYTRPSSRPLLDFDNPIPGIQSFYDLYIALLTQYAAVSYGDPLFASFVILPLQRRFSCHFKRALWTEHVAVISNMRMPLTQILLSLDEFLYPTETDQDMLNLYVSGLMTASVTRTSPFFYLLAVHHTNSYFFCEKPQDIRHHRQFLCLALGIKNQTLLDIVRYGGLLQSAALGFSTQLPLARKMTLKRILDSLENRDLANLAARRIGVVLV